MRKAVATGAVALVVAGSALLGPVTAQAETIDARCGQTVTVKPGDQIQTPFGLRNVTDGLTSLVGGLLSGLCTVTVNVVDTVISPAPVVGAPLAGAVNSTVSGTTKGLSGTTDKVVSALAPKPQNPPAAQTPPTDPAHQTAPEQQANPPVNSGATAPGTTAPQTVGNQLSATNLFGFGYWSSGLFSSSLFTGYAPMRDYGFLPMATPGVFSPAPSLRYGEAAPGSPSDLGVLGQFLGNAAGTMPLPQVRNAGHAEALPQPESNPVHDLGLPVLLAVLALTGIGAVLVRTWVLRRTSQ
jgi:hypothetical protein